MSQYYNQDYTKDEISAVLQKIQECVSSGKYSVAQNENRAENIAFIREYNLTSDKQRRILMQIDVDDFCHSLQNTKLGFEHEILFVFCPQVTLYNIEDEEKHLDLIICNMDRKQELYKLGSEKEFDIVIIGGGATGLGCAVDAASRGYKTVLLERYDFSKGTSSRSTKLVHGGVISRATSAVPVAMSSTAMGRSAGSMSARALRHNTSMRSDSTLFCMS